MKLRRLVAVLLCAVLLTALCLPAGATEYREHRAPPQLPSWPPSFTETQVSCVSEAGTLRGLLTRPGNTEAPVPMAILLHGLNTDKSWCDDIAWILADNGIASVRFDFDGTGDSDGAQADMTISSEVRDTVAILKYVQSLQWVDRDNIFLVGKSMGGVDAMLAAQGHGDEIKAICLWYPGFGIGELARDGFFLGERFFPFFPPETLTVAGYTYGREFLREAQVVDCAAACRSYQGPVLILHGDQDPIAPLFFSIAMSQELQNGRLEVLPGGGHGFWGAQELFALNMMLDFFQEQLGS